MCTRSLRRKSSRFGSGHTPKDKNEKSFLRGMLILKHASDSFSILAKRKRRYMQQLRKYCFRPSKQTAKFAGPSNQSRIQQREEFSWSEEYQQQSVHVHRPLLWHESGYQDHRLRLPPISVKMKHPLVVTPYYTLNLYALGPRNGCIDLFFSFISPS